MKARCLDTSHRMYPHYGGAGITIDPSWLGPGGFERFLLHLGPRPPGCTLERRDRGKGYEPGNVTWADRWTQSRNHTNVLDAKRYTATWPEWLPLHRTPLHYRHLFGQTLSLTTTAWSDLLGIPADTLRVRLRAGKTGSALTAALDRKQSLCRRSGRPRKRRKHTARDAAREKSNAYVALTAAEISEACNAAPMF